MLHLDILALDVDLILILVLRVELSDGKLLASHLVLVLQLPNPIEIVKLFSVLSLVDPDIDLGVGRLKLKTRRKGSILL